MLLSLLVAAVWQDVQIGVVYTKPANVSVSMDIYKPTSNKASGAAVVLIHGGAWIGGERALMAPFAKILAEEGFLAATISYRLAPKHKWPAMLDDAQTAVRYLRTNAAQLGINPNRIGAAGVSAGGHLSLLLGSMETRDKQATEHTGVSSKVAAVFDIFGPSDFSQDHPASYDMLFHIVLGKPREQAADLIREASPVTHVTSSSAPTFIMHGLADTMVNPNQSRLIHERLRKAGVSSELHMIDGMAHDIDPNNAKVKDVVKRAIAWLRLKLTAQ